MENFKLKDGTVLGVEQVLIGTELNLKIENKTLSEVEELFTKDNISRVALEDVNGEYAVFTDFNATSISKDSVNDFVRVELYTYTTEDEIKRDMLQALNILEVTE